MFRFRPFALALLLASTALGADPTNKPAPKPEPPQRVNVVETNGKIVSGLLTHTDHAGLTVKPATGDELLVPWSDVKSTSNPKLTRANWLATFKKDNAERLCDTCHGDALQTCDTCKGTGVDPAQAKPCETCKGTGGIGPCPTKGCVEGKIDCPGPCLKLSRGVWKDKDGLKVQTFQLGGGKYMWISEHHLGEVWVQEKGEMVSKGQCTVCNGTTKVDDPACKGKGHKLCPDCKGNGVTGPACTTCTNGQTKCQTCKGTGLKPA